MLTLDFHFPTGKTVGPGGIFKCSTAQIWGRGNVIKVKPFPFPFQCVFFLIFFLWYKGLLQPYFGVQVFRIFAKVFCLWIAASCSFCEKDWSWESTILPYCWCHYPWKDQTLPYGAKSSLRPVFLKYEGKSRWPDGLFKLQIATPPTRRYHLGELWLFISCVL